MALPKPILLIFPTHMEGAAFLPNNYSEEKYFFSYKEGVDVLISGVGIMLSTFRLTRHLEHHHYDFAVHAGIAGSYDTRLSLGSLVLVKQDCFADMGVRGREHFHSLEDLGLEDKIDSVLKDGFIINATAVPEEFMDLHRVNAATVNSLQTEPKINTERSQKFNAQVESMEGAALSYVCTQHQLPYVQLRAISNYAGERDKSKWEIAKAVEGLGRMKWGV
jgi:futalosine hydrolase